MNKIYKWFYQKEKQNQDNENSRNGIGVIDEEKYDKYIKIATRSRIIYTCALMFFVLIILGRILL